MLHPSTFSIVACDPDSSELGVAVASKFLAVGKVVPWARAAAGAVATQSYANTSYGSRGLELMENGLTAAEALQVLLADDPQPELRQVGMVDARGNVATYTGKSCHDWAGGLTGTDFAAQGNILASADVIQAMAGAFSSSTGNLAWRLYRALVAGDRTGGDRRGRQSAAIYVVKPGAGYGGYDDRWIDYRVDDHPDPVKRLGELLEMHDLFFEKSSSSDQVELSGEHLCLMQDIMARHGYYGGDIHGRYDAPTRAALEVFIGNENFEERVDFNNGRIDQPVFQYLLRRFQEAA
jgi:uncharacterized Ntn-hydrolase superfamily protein